MASVDRILQLKLIGDVAGIRKDLKDTEAAVGGLTGKARQFGGAVASWGKAFVGNLVLDGITAIVDGVNGGIDDFREAQRVSAQLRNTWENLGLAGEELDGIMDDLGGRALDLGFDDTASLAVFDQLIKTTRDADDASRLLQASWDLARAEGISLEAAGKQVTAMYLGQSRALKRFGVEGVSGIEAVDAAWATFHGAAESHMETDEGRMERFQGRIGEIFEAIGGIIVGLTTPFLDLMDALEPILQDIEALIGEVDVGAMFTSLQEGVERVIPHIENLLAAIQPLIDLGLLVLQTTIENVKLAIDGFFDLLEGDLDGAFAAVQGIIGNLTDLFTTTVGTVGQLAIDLGAAIFGGIVDGVAGLGRSLMDILAGAVRDGLNALIKVWNSLAIPELNLAIPHITAPNPLHGTVLDFHGKPEFSIFGPGVFKAWDRIPVPQVKPLAEGGIVRGGRGGILALIGEGPDDEAVIPLDGRSMGDSTVINVTVNLSGVITNPAETGRQVAEAIRAYVQRGGTLVTR